MNFKKKWTKKYGKSEIMTKENSSCKLMEIDMVKLSDGQKKSYSAKDTEFGILIFGGKCSVEGKDFSFANIGKRDDGTLYKLEPDEDSMVKAKMKANSFRPYIGFGYGNSMMNNDNKYNVSFDCGLLFWGGVPDVITHDGTNLTKGFKEVYGKVGRYVDIVEKFEIFPVVNLRIAYRIF